MKKEKTSKKYAISVLFEKKHEKAIKARAESLGVSLASYIRMLVMSDLNRLNESERSK